MHQRPQLSGRLYRSAPTVSDVQMEADVADVKEQLAQALFDHIPVGVGSQGIIPTSARDLEAALEMGMDWSLREVRGCRKRSPAPIKLLLAIPSCQGHFAKGVSLL